MARMIICVLLTMSFSLAHADSIVGSWKFTSMIMEGQEVPPLNPDLILTFDFAEDGSDRLFWTRKGESGFCERRARYDFDSNWLYEAIVWVNPDNAPECGKDPDMQLGRVTQTPARIKNGRFELDLNVGDSHLTYIFERATP